MNIILLGAPGSGKGTQAELLAKKLNLFYLQTGDMAREWAKTDPKIKEIVDSGKLIPEKIMTDYVKKYLEKNVPEGDNILFEGFPRYVPQYEEYKKWVGSKGHKINAVIILDISEEAVIKRLSSRRICEKCKRVYNLVTNPPKNSGICDECGGKLIQRKDDNPKSIKTRFAYFRENTEKLMNYLESNGGVIEVDADRPIEVIFEDILGKLKEKGVWHG